MSRPRPGYRDGPYVDDPDPPAPPFDLRAAMDEIGRDVMEGASPRSALQGLLRRGDGEPALAVRGAATLDHTAGQHAQRDPHDRHRLGLQQVSVIDFECRCPGLGRS